MKYCFTHSLNGKSISKWREIKTVFRCVKCVFFVHQTWMRLVGIFLCVVMLFARQLEFNWLCRSSCSHFYEWKRRLTTSRYIFVNKIPIRPNDKCRWTKIAEVNFLCFIQIRVILLAGVDDSVICMWSRFSARYFVAIIFSLSCYKFVASSLRLLIFNRKL